MPTYSLLFRKLVHLLEMLLYSMCMLFLVWEDGNDTIRYSCAKLNHDSKTENCYNEEKHVLLHMSCEFLYCHSFKHHCHFKES